MSLSREDDLFEGNGLSVALEGQVEECLEVDAQVGSEMER